MHESEVYVPPNPVGLLQLSPTGFQSQMFWGLILLMLDLGLGSQTVGLRTLTPVEEPLQYNYSPVCGLPTPGGWDLIISPVYPTRPTLISLWFLLPLFVGISWYVLVFFIDGCSADICDFWCTCKKK